ncbi:SDR family oxidoreductase, partial [Nonomuraea mesophila]|uniref:SDR family oxidoreductase n=1 Tax=Nonomuraea mesophila TaxID=2530382 RepID=UPI001FEBCB0B
PDAPATHHDVGAHHDVGTHDGRGIQPGSTGSPDGGVVTAAGGHGPDQDGESAGGGGNPGNGETGTGLIAATIPAGRMATPTDVAHVCLWLAAPGYVTGAEVRVDGGGEIPAWRHLTA